MAQEPGKKSRTPRKDLPEGASSEGKLNLLMKYLVVSGKDEMKISRSMDAKVEDLSLTGLVFQTPTMKVDGLHLSYDESPSLRNKLTIEINLPNRRKINAIGEVSWYEKSFVKADPVYHVGVNFKEMSRDDREALRDYLVSIKKTVKPIDLNV